MKDRIHMIMDSLQMSQQDFAKKLEISAASLSSIFTGRTNPTNNHVQAIHKAFPSINVEWLMFGEGSMLSSATSENLEENGSSQETNSDHNITTSTVFTNNKNVENDLIDGDLFSSVVPNIKPKPEVRVVEETKVIRRKVKEIRVFYDDGTYESFIPGN